ncbi:MAG: hypothetical protein ACE5Z5_14770 [Candidatus Bathyarchaeia archaeon]
MTSSVQRSFLGKLTKATTKKRVALYSLLVVILTALSIVAVKYGYERWVQADTRISIEDAQFRLKPDGRYIDVRVRATGYYDVDISEIRINRSRVVTFTTSNDHLKPGSEAEISVWYLWSSGRNHELTVITRQGAYDKSLLLAPEFTPSIEFKALNLTKTPLLPEKTEPFRLDVTYLLNISGFSWAHASFFLYKSYEAMDRPIYVFYDPNYMPKKTLDRADCFLIQAQRYGLDVYKANWDELEGLAHRRPRIILLLLNPLMNVSGGEFYDSIPSCIFDPDEDGYASPHSAYGYGKSIIYDWERDHGLIFISAGSVQAPSGWVIAKNGTAYFRRDGGGYDEFFANISGAFKSIEDKSTDLTRAGQNLRLHAWGGWWQLNTTMIEKSVGPADYYVYGRVGDTDLSQPCFIKNGRGGWLYLGDGWNLGDSVAASDLVKMVLHAPWDAEQLGPHSWDRYSGFKIYMINGGELTEKDSVSLGTLMTVPDTTVVTLLRIVLAYDSDTGYHAFIETTRLPIPEG